MAAIDIETVHEIDRDDRKRRGVDVPGTVDGRNAKSGEETTVPIPEKTTA